MPLPGTDSVVTGAFEPLLDMGRGKNSVSWATLFVVSSMLALRWIEENVTKYRESTAPTAESIHANDYNWRLELFETACKIFFIPMEVRHVWSRIRFFPWFRATLTSWLNTVTKDHMKKPQKEYRQFLAEIGPEAYKRPLLTDRNAITTGWKRVGRVSRDNIKARGSILEEDLAKNMSLSLHNSFYRNRESKMKVLPNQAKRLQEQREWIAGLRTAEGMGRDPNQFR